MVLVGPRAAVQNMLPALGQGVLDHSVFFSDTFARVKRSAGPILDTVYGAERSAETGRKVRDYHHDIKGTMPDGTRYHALDPETYYWAHATFLDNMLYGIETFIRPLSDAEKRRIYEESKTWFRMYGVSDRAMPDDWEAFQAYWKRMLDEEIVPTRPPGTASATSRTASRGRSRSQHPYGARCRRPQRGSPFHHRRRPTPTHARTAGPPVDHHRRTPLPPLHRSRPSRKPGVAATPKRPATSPKPAEPSARRPR